jgi:hypothetical protein
VLGVFGDIKYFSYPLFLIYDPIDYLVTGEDYDQFTKLLQTGDIVLRTYDHYLDGIIIPGFYSHAALYIGDGILVHSCSHTGVSKINLFEFAKCDGLAIVRPKVGYAAINKAIKYALNQLGKDYDYWFNYDNEETYCCTELIYWAYENILSTKPIMLKKFFGLAKREVIAPDAYLIDDKCELIWESSYCKKNRGV